MKKQIIIYGLIYGVGGGLLIAFLKWTEYRFVVIEYSIEIYGALIALVFAGVGIWLGLKLTKKKEVLVEKEVFVVKEVPVPARQTFMRNESKLNDLGITKRELE